MTVRELTPFEKNHLIRFDFDLEKISQFGEMPVEYITGFAKFFDQYFVVNKDVLIPRVETEELVERILDEYKSREKVSFLEVGTGSGALGISIFNKLIELGVQVECVLSDVSGKSLEVAKKNVESLVEENQLKNITLIESNLLEKLKDLSFYFCVANLPYIPSSRISKLPGSVKDFEPVLALDGGEDGLKLIKKLIKELEDKKFIGDLFLEVDDTHDEQAMSVFGNKLKKTWKDSFNKNRFAWMSF